MAEQKSIKNLMHYIFFMFILPWIFWQIFVFMNDGKDPSKASGGNNQDAAMKEILKNQNIDMQDAMAEFSKNSVFQGQENGTADIMNRQMGIMGVPGAINPNAQKPNPNVKEYIDEDGIKVRIEVKD